jgi:hypothetical protein
LNSDARVIPDPRERAPHVLKFLEDGSCLACALCVDDDSNPVRQRWFTGVLEPTAFLEKAPPLREDDPSVLLYWDSPSASGASSPSSPYSSSPSFSPLLHVIPGQSN